MQKVNTDIIHCCQYASQPNILYACGVWVVPAYTGTYEPVDPILRESGIYVGDNYELYTFDPARTTCTACLAAMQLVEA